MGTRLTAPSSNACVLPNERTNDRTFDMNKILLIALVVSSTFAERLSNGYGAPPASSRGNGRNGNGISNNYGAPGGRNGNGNGNGINSAYSAPSASAPSLSNNYAAPSNNVFNTGGNGFSNGNGGNGGFNGGNNGYSNGNGAASEQELLAASIPGGGVPGEDFPLLSEVPDTGFQCEDQTVGGYYADDADEAGCQVFHICQLRESGLVQKDSFLCPNGTIFNQQYLVCDWWYNFDCSTAQDFYSVNEEIGVAPEGAASNDAGYAAPSNGGGNGRNGYSNGANSRPNTNGGNQGSGYASSNGNGRNGNGFSNGGSRGGYGY